MVRFDAIFEPPTDRSRDVQGLVGQADPGQDLTPEELTEFVEAMRDDEVTDVQIAGFLVAL